jgi:hypothetical protein
MFRRFLLRLRSRPSAFATGLDFSDRRIVGALMTFTRQGR